MNHILHARSTHHYWRGVGALSIKCFWGGRALYSVGGGLHAVDQDGYLVLNDGQTYTIEIEATQPVESFCVFFDATLIKDAARSASASVENLLDSPSGESNIQFFERVYPHDHWVSPLIAQLRERTQRRMATPGWLEEQMHHLMIGLLVAHHHTAVEVDHLDAVRPATREELYRRVYRARDYAAAAFDQPLTLDDLARVAALSPNHLLRTFKQVFRQTPHQFLTAQRLERARTLLHTSQPVTQICFEVGFESPGSFSWLFRKRYSLSPQQYRQQNR
jgi:AraC family transcriptional regulator